MSRSYDAEFFTPLQGAAKRPKIAAFDIETKDGDSQVSGFTRPFQVGLYDGERYRSYFDTNRPRPGSGFTPMPWQRRYHSQGGCVDLFMRTALSKAFIGYWLYAHNGGNFDFLFLLPWLRENADKLGLTVRLIPAGVSGLLAIDVVSKECKFIRWRFIDSVKLLPMTLAKAATAFAVGEKYTHFEGGGAILDAQGRPFDMNNDVPEDDPGWLPYNESDCRLLYGVVEKAATMVEDVFGGELKMTAPSTAMATYRRAFLRTAIERDTISHEFIREGYVGGRTEKFIADGKRLSYVDVNSSYVYSMTKLLPAGGGRRFVGKPPKAFLHPGPRDIARVGFCRVTVKVPEDCPIPPLPVRASDAYFPRGAGVEGKLVFPVGTLKGVWEWDELQNAIETCGAEVVEWHESWWYVGEPILREFVETLYKYRHKAKCFECGGGLCAHPKDSTPYWCERCESYGYSAALDAWAKLLGNSSYGRFAMNPERVKLYWRGDPEMPDGAMPLIDGDPECQLWTATEEVDDVAIMPQVSARITALSRVLLHRYAMEAISRVNRCCDRCHSKVTFKRAERGAAAGKPTGSVVSMMAPVGGFGPHGDESASVTIAWQEPECPCGGPLRTEQCQVYYMDTDSLMTDAYMESSSELGALKDEIPRYAGFLTGRFYAPKLYRLGVSPAYATLPEETRRAMLKRDKGFEKKLLEGAEAAVKEYEDPVGVYELVKAKGMSRKLRTAENLERLYSGAMARLQWLASPGSYDERGHRKKMPKDIEEAGTVVDSRLEKLGTLAGLTAKDKDGQPVLRKTADGAMRPVSDAFGRGPLMVSVPKRLHLAGAKRIEKADGTTRPYVVDMSRPEPDWWLEREMARTARKIARRKKQA